MAKIIFGSARIDENGNARGGSAGDQTGKEVSTQAGYVHSKGWRVFRAPSGAKAHKLAFAMASACANPNIGYDQNQRDTLFNAVKNAGFDTSKVAKKVETDCSALVRVCAGYAGYLLPDFYTGNEAETLLHAGFVEIKFKSIDDLRTGDILVTKSKGHTVIVVHGFDDANVTMANYVIRGCWGNGDARKKALTEAGFDYSAIQREVNARLKA